MKVNKSRPLKSSTTGVRKYLLDLRKASKRRGAKKRAKISCFDDLTVMQRFRPDFCMSLKTQTGHQAWEAISVLR
jgi:hypothetical protein